MTNLKTLTAQKRLALGKGAAHRLRRNDLVPGIFYSSTGENIPLQIPTLPLEKIFSEVGHTTVFNLEITENTTKQLYPVVIWKTQSHPVKKQFMHIDFYGVDLNKPIKITVPLEFVGIARGSKVGGKLEIYREELSLLANPLDMPSKITIDISNLDIGKSIHVADILLPVGVTSADNTNYPIVSVVIPRGSATTEQQEE